MVCLGNEQSQMETMFIIEITISSPEDLSFNFFYINFCFIIYLQWWGWGHTEQGKLGSSKCLSQINLILVNLVLCL